MSTMPSNEVSKENTAVNAARNRCPPAEVVAMVVHQVHQLAMLDHHTFGVPVEPDV
jgi:hypothetical protein